ncbi:putative protease [Desulfohalotomaculum tongense]|uniref:peptidase U32 family protein n=1 Tax=Desulforadius tongensis TaxID=1216062 RepID=UPI00195709D9|nr:U32 family peptidase [Desulforadius tongensis]MBM7854043.1 putative protease [Desulforadius tongensis]
MHKPELLAPAGDLEKLKSAIIYGADAVYLGGKQFSLRAGAANFGRQELAEGVEFAHRHGANVYVAVNIFAHNQDIETLPGYFSFLEDVGVDGVIVSDPGVLTVLRRTAPDLPVHLSTQANTTNYVSARFWQEQGVKRIVLARELSLEEIKQTAARVDVELEVFVHGAMCMAYSGRCLLSSYLTGRDANRGDCAQPCRWKYHLVEEKRPGQYFPVLEEERGTYFMSSRDLCLIEYIPQLIKAGVKSFKIEGRMKSVHYVSTVVKSYRQAIDRYFADPQNYTLDERWMEEISKVSHRDYTTGFILGPPGREAQSDKPSQYRRDYSFVGIVRRYDQGTGMALVEQRNNFAVGDKVEVFQPRGENFTFTVREIYSEEGEPQSSAPHPQQRLKIPMQPVERWSMLRKIVK